jgi:tRNA threonylcarbamoyladenosine biosynthesis protein TsaB
VLAVDSSTHGGSVAVGIDGEAVALRELPRGAGASSRLMPAVDAVVREAGLAPRELGAVVAGGGPGSFTGLRIAAATAKGIVRALGVPLFAYSGLLAAAALRREAGRPVCALFDARNREVYAGCWRFDGGAPVEVLPVSALGMGELLARVAPGREVLLFTGEGAALHREEIAAALGAEAVDPEPEAPLAAGLLWLAHAAPGLGRVADAAAWEPEYVRASGAERIAAARG